MSKKLKQSKVNPKTIVQPYVHLEYKKHYFNWSISYSYLDLENKEFELFRDRNEFFNILKKLDSYRNWLWLEIERSKNNTSNGIMDINKLDTKDIVQNHLFSINKKDVDMLYKIEIDNHHRVWGIREGSCLFLIWNDPEHRFYKHRNANYIAKKYKSSGGSQSLNSLETSKHKNIYS